MKCPGCKCGDLVQKYLPNQLKVYQCRSCEGKWINALDYGSWLKKIKNAKNSSRESIPESAIAVADSAGPKICPGCKYLMMRHRIGKGVSFTLDQCGHCHSIWLDIGKWEALEEQALQIYLHAIASPSWQWQLRQTQRQDFIQDLYADRLASDYDAVQQFQHWLADHPERGTILTVLNSSPWSHKSEIA
jgi:Zn-finger nucleic acid-binding protein